MAENVLDMKAHELFAIGIKRFNDRVQEKIKSIKDTVVQIIQSDPTTKEWKLDSYRTPSKEIRAEVFAALINSGLIIREEKSWFVTSYFISGWHKEEKKNDNPYR
jgi:hypothetical protein